MPGRSKAPKRSNPGSWREAAELASEAARAEGASISSQPSRRRADVSGTVATTPRGGGGRLTAAADQPEQAGPLLGVRGDQQPHGGLPAAAGEPREGPLAVFAVAGGAAVDRCVEVA